MPVVSRLPPEVLLVIKESIPEWDLRTHACYYLSHTSISALFDSEEDPDAFWEMACWRCGLGGGPGSGEFPPSSWVSWKKFALDTIERDGFCEHPRCGERLLEANRMHMDLVAEDVETLALARVREGKVGEFPKLGGHPIFSLLRFRRYRRRACPEEDAYLFQDMKCMVPGGSGTTAELEATALANWDVSKNTLACHPLVAHSFATFPPTARITIVSMADISTPHGGVAYKGYGSSTVLDVMEAIYECLDTQLLVDTVADYLDRHEESCVPKRQTIAKTIRKLRTLRHMLRLCPIVELRHHSTNYPMGAYMAIEVK